MNIQKNKKTPRGFTLIELLVVISIIGILSSFAVVSLNSARVKARDALRKGDMAQIRTALGLYYYDNNKYPECGTWDDLRVDFGATIGDAVGDGSDCYIWLGTILTAGARPIIQQMPLDPQNNNNKAATDPVHIYRYVTDPGGTQYAMVYTLEEGGETVFRGW
ncbi:MAG: Type II secretion system pseudopilin OxpG [Candidatus Falkowbacteria bacterium GW2011_GWC2_38_22]|uniref:Type II secretion system pseudopilin OxpG n=1 Tax=Candidatus Falkowbacteria bacterium GW2011_GWE1_38_31 TaxID=1618638 RepID=A0A0G0K393_9BACT|nr:MAG: Type II secretion system pseudopilin OxpG [Candidatus Falkowbacteria bacterium GW2011_GWF2_38_1205]KKQ61103.1 MAG: Type II secretion system pseudopilin OxpG [Candidatus Falkowbacteria bacterium GW2011_GWC2_38_22]KKQ63173.1 MAG: Type II secretion system pseudopilin OxpG [Candidatus Falkowbacteria bacterium GW2011_GWF1_38_22]KKQ65368.1 MAG: Type II secretion system pseudopilin OxpG [Candidatus Falkowbacteria bacterium GW2011_GWE2_38_254]KKQ69945.1 MAG: Type II secretion system pseudopilin